MTTEIKSCPFCGCESCIVRTGGGGCAWVECRQCKADGPEHLQGVDAAVAAWNAAPRMWPKPLTPASGKEGAMGKLMCGDVEVDREAFVTASVLLILDDLKKRGLVDGGPEIIRPTLEAIRAVGVMAGMPEPSKDEIIRMVNYFRRGGEWEKEYDGERDGAA